MNTHEKPHKPLGKKAYGSIPHLPGSRRGPADKGLSDQQASLLTVKTRDRHDVVIVQEKLDGSNVSVANIDGEIIAITRAGYQAENSIYEMHHHFKRWVDRERHRFAALLNPGERACGEWLMQAHGTRYNLPHEPFVIFDIMKGSERLREMDVAVSCKLMGFTTPKLLHCGSAISIEAILEKLEPSGHGAIDPVEGAVWRMERRGVVEFLGKYVRSDKIDGKYLPGHGSDEPVYNWISDV